MNGQVVSGEIDTPNAAFYTGIAALQTPRLLSYLDREVESKTFGNFDREYWGWKFHDFPMTMLQSSICPLALLWRAEFPGNVYHRNSNLLSWLIGAVENTCSRQRRTGAFDSVGPNAGDHGVTLAMVYALTEALRHLTDGLPGAVVTKVKETVARACRFARRSQEGYAFISNHRALFALAYLNAHELLGDAEDKERAEATVDSILRRQSSDGWYLEYGGPDPGYESLGLFYLATYWSRTGTKQLLESVKRSVEFFSYCVHPDGSIGGVYGSRHTSLFFPAGFEILSNEIPLAAAVARFMRVRLKLGNIVTPATCDRQNLALLLYTYFLAGLASPSTTLEGLPKLPCENLKGVKIFPGADLLVNGTNSYYAVFAGSRGGVCRIFDKQSRKITFEDAGYVVRSGRRSWSSQFLGLGCSLKTGTDQYVFTSTFGEIRQTIPSPLSFLLLRILNLTVFCSQAFVDCFTKFVIRKLITKTRRGPFRLVRSVQLGPSKIVVEDQIEATGSTRVDAVTLPKSFMAIHMGSAKYFHPAELEITFQPDARHMMAELNESGRARNTFVISFSPTVVERDEVKDPSGTASGPGSYKVGTRL